MRTKRAFAISVLTILLLACASLSLAVLPGGWTYHNGNYAYSRDVDRWFYFNQSDTQWMVNLNTGVWGTLDSASGWYYHNWPYAYSSSAGSWFWFKMNDAQWVCDMSNGVWSLFGYDPAPGGMASIPGGTNAGTDPDFGAYSLTTTTFYMDQYEVTKELWDEVKGWNGGNGYSYDNDGSSKDTNHPVHTVNWYDCVKWCNARSEKEGREPVYYTDIGLTEVYKDGQVDDVYVKAAADGYRLPTEGQWEYAARGGAVGLRYPWGDTITHANANYVYDGHGSHPDYDEDPQPYTSPVGSFASNAYGLYDMAGNVAEWCQDLLAPDDPYQSRVVRGGCWHDRYHYCRVGDQYWDRPIYADDDFGFRTVLVP